MLFPALLIGAGSTPMKMDAFTQALMSRLPYLRRYARALCGSAEKGDVLVTEVVDAVLTASPAIPSEDPAFLRYLYRMVNRQADRMPPMELHDEVHPIEAALRTLPETERRAFLLVNLEELSAHEATDVLQMELNTVIRALDHARDVLHEQLLANILIVEDDAIIAYDLAQTVLGMGHKVAGTAATVDEALALAEETKPSLALMDVRLARGGNGVTVAQHLRRRSNLPIIFVTAFADELIRRGYGALGPVIRKPFNREDIEKAITRAVFTPRPAEQAGLAEPVLTDAGTM